MKIRIARKADADQLLRIYTPFIIDSAVSFETELPSIGEFQSRIAAYTRIYPWLVCEHESQIIGYAYANAYRDRIAYQWSCECSVYLDKNFKRKGLGRILYAALFEILRYQNFVNVYAGITFPNPSSIKFHKANGFNLFSVYKKVGYKLGKWHNVRWYLKKLNVHANTPKQPKAFSKIKKSNTVKMILKRFNEDLARM